MYLPQPNPGSDSETQKPYFPIPQPTRENDT